MRGRFSLSLEGFYYLLVHHCLAKFYEEVGFLLSTSQKVAKETFLWLLEKPQVEKGERRKVIEGLAVFARVSQWNKEQYWRKKKNSRKW